MATAPSTPLPTHHQPEVTPLHNPTEEFLLNNYTKVELQKQCRNLGLKNVWASKENLASMIVGAAQRHESYQVTRADTVPDLENSGDAQPTDTLQQDQQDQDDVSNCVTVEQLMKKIQKAHKIIENTQSRLATLGAVSTTPNSQETTAAGLAVSSSTPSTPTVCNCSSLGARVLALKELLTNPSPSLPSLPHSSQNLPFHFPPFPIHPQPTAC